MFVTGEMRDSCGNGTEQCLDYSGRYNKIHVWENCETLTHKHKYVQVNTDDSLNNSEEHQFHL